MKNNTIKRFILLISFIMTIVCVDITNVHAESSYIVNDLGIYQFFYDETNGSTNTFSFKLGEHYNALSYEVGAAEGDESCRYGCTYVNYNNDINPSSGTELTQNPYIEVVKGGNIQEAKENIDAEMETIWKTVVLGGEKEPSDDYYRRIIAELYTLLYGGSEDNAKKCIANSSTCKDILTTDKWCGYADRYNRAGPDREKGVVEPPSSACFEGASYVVAATKAKDNANTYANFCKIITNIDNEFKKNGNNNFISILEAGNSAACGNAQSDTGICAHSTKHNLAESCLKPELKTQFIKDLKISVQYITQGSQDFGDTIRKAAERITAKEGKNVLVTGTNYITQLHDLYELLSQKDVYVCARRDNNLVRITEDQSTKPSLDDCKRLLGDEARVMRKQYKVNATKTLVSNDSTVFTCGWNNKLESGATARSEIKVTVSKNDRDGLGSIKVGAIENVQGLSVRVSLSPSELKGILNRENILSSFASGIYTGEVKLKAVEAAKTTAIVIGVAMVVGSVASAIVNPYATVPALIVGVVKAAASVSFKVILTTVIVGGIDMVGNFIIELKCTTGTCPVDVSFAYPTNLVSSGNNANATCSYPEKQSDDSGELEQDFEVTCESIMSGKFGEIVKTIMNIIRFAGVALLILLGAIDFIGPIVSGNQDALQKSGGKFVKRIIVLVLILFVPAIVELLLSLIGRSCSSGL